jgi:hypothetical protein
MEGAIKRALLEGKGQQQAPEGFGFEGFSPGSELPEIPQFIKRGAPAAIGAAAGGGLAALTGPAFPLSAPILTALGGLAGEGIAQATGIGGATFDPLSLLLSGATPPAARTGVGAARIGSRFATPGRAALTLNPLAEQEVRGAIQALTPAQKAGPLFALARAEGIQVPAGAAQKAADSVLEALTGPAGPSKGAQREFARVIDYAKGLKEKLAANKGVLNPDELQNELHAIGEISASMQRQGGPGLKFIGEIKAGLAKSLEGAPKLKLARDTYLREQTVADLAGYLEDATTLRRGLGEAAQFNPNVMLKKLKADPFYEHAFTAAERLELEGLLKTLNKIPVLPPPGGQQFGAGRGLQRLAQIGAGGAFGQFAGGGKGAGIGMMAGAAIPPTVDMFRNIGLALSMKEGRALLGALLSGSDGAVTPHVSAMLGAFAASQASETLNLSGRE